MALNKLSFDKIISKAGLFNSNYFYILILPKKQIMVNANFW